MSVTSKAASICPPLSCAALREHGFADISSLVAVARSSSKHGNIVHAGARIAHPSHSNRAACQTTVAEFGVLKSVDQYSHYYREAV